MTKAVKEQIKLILFMFIVFVGPLTFWVYFENAYVYLTQVDESNFWMLLEERFKNYFVAEEVDVENVNHVGVELDIKEEIENYKKKNSLPLILEYDHKDESRSQSINNSVPPIMWITPYFLDLDDLSTLRGYESYTVVDLVIYFHNEFVIRYFIMLLPMLMKLFSIIFLKMQYIAKLFVSLDNWLLATMLFMVGYWTKGVTGFLKYFYILLRYLFVFLSLFTVYMLLMAISRMWSMLWVNLGLWFYVYFYIKLTICILFILWLLYQIL